MKLRGVVFVGLLAATMPLAMAADQCEGIYQLAKSAQQGFNDMTGVLLYQDERGASYQATYSMPRGDCKIFRGKGLEPTYECVWDFREQTTAAMDVSASNFARDVARCTRTELTARSNGTRPGNAPVEWRTGTRRFGNLVNFAISAVDLVSKRGERIREISLSVEKK